MYSNSPPDASEENVGGGTAGVELDGVVSDSRGLVGTGGGRELGGGRGALALALGVDGVDPVRVVAIFLSLENRFPFVPFASVSVEGVGKGSESVDGTTSRGRSLREECVSCGSTVVGAGGTGVGAMLGTGGLFGSETLLVAGTCRGGSGALYSETLRWWAAGVGGRVDRGTGGRVLWRGPDGGKGGGMVLSWSVCVLFCEIDSDRSDSGAASASSSSCGSILVGVFRHTSSCELYPRLAKYWHIGSHMMSSATSKRVGTVPHLRIRKRVLCF